MHTALVRSPRLRAVQPLVTARGWRALTHNLLGLPLGVAYFCWFVTGLSLGAGLAITLVGIPLLTGVLASVRPLVNAERRLANALLDTDVERLPAVPPSRGGWLSRLAAYWTDGTTWRGLAYLFARFPLGLGTFCVALIAYALAIGLLLGPVLAPVDDLQLGFWDPDTVLEGFLAMPFGVVALVLAGWVSEGMAQMSRALVRWFAR